MNLVRAREHVLRSTRDELRATLRVEAFLNDDDEEPGLSRCDGGPVAVSGGVRRQWDRRHGDGVEHRQHRASGPLNDTTHCRPPTGHQNTRSPTNTLKCGSGIASRYPTRRA